MKIALGVMKFDLDAGTEFEFDVMEPGIVRHTFVEFGERKLIIGGQRKATATPCVAIEVHPGAPRRKRRFILLPADTVVDYPGDLEFFAMFTNPTSGGIVAVYEVTRVDVAELAGTSADPDPALLELPETK